MYQIRGVEPAVREALDGTGNYPAQSSTHDHITGVVSSEDNPADRYQNREGDHDRSQLRIQVGENSRQRERRGGVATRH